ncbi:MAG: DUF58 domain-containing protein [Thiogranum sp.]
MVSSSNKRKKDGELDERIYVSIAKLVRLRYQARGFSFLPKQPIQSLLTGRKRSKLRGRGLDFIELRGYRPGDDIRTMDWRVTNRTRKPHVRVYAEEKDRPVMMLIDQRQSMFFGSKWKMKSVIAAELAAVAAWRVLDVGDRVGAVLFNDQSVEEYKPSRNMDRLLHLFSRIKKFNHALSIGEKKVPMENAEPVSLKQVLEVTKRLVGHDYLVVLISDFSGWDTAALSSLKRIARHNDVIAGLVYDPLEADISQASRLVVGDGQYQLEINTKQGGLSERFSEQTKSSFKELQQELRKHDVPVLPISTEKPVFEQLRKHLGGGR